MPRLDIREYKKKLRAKYREFRVQMPAHIKAQKDSRIARRFCSLRVFQKAELVLCYVSTPIEVGTWEIMERAWKAGKRVAVPYCLPQTTAMQFYEIHSFDDLEPRTFGVLEPIPERCAVVTDFSHSVAVVPGLCFDSYGYRLGYGKGYYDRFLQKYRGTKIGICYQKCTKTELIHGRYDVAVDLLITEYTVHPKRNKEKAHIAQKDVF